MNIAFVAFTHGAELFCRGLRRAFQEEGHRVRFFYQVGSTLKNDDFRQMNWNYFSFKALKEFQPDKVIVFNGWADETKPATHYMTEHWNTHFFEIGWLPQKGHIYVDKDGLGSRSHLCRQDLSRDGYDEALWKRLVKEYEAPRKPASLPREYVLVPLQLEHDTSIKYDSPYFKTMASFVSFALKSFAGKHVIIKTHPKNKGGLPKIRGSDVTVISDEHSMNTLAAHATCVMGINSTSLMEALVHLKPVGALGYNVLSGSEVWLQPPRMLTTPKALLTYKPDIVRIKNTVCTLYNQQVPWHEVTDATRRVVKALTS